MPEKGRPYGAPIPDASWGKAAVPPPGEVPCEGSYTQWQILWTG